MEVLYPRFLRVSSRGVFIFSLKEIGDPPCMRNWTFSVIVSMWAGAVLIGIVTYGILVNSPDAPLNVHRVGGIFFFGAPIVSLGLSITWLRRRGAAEVRRWHGGKVALLWVVLVLTLPLLQWIARVAVICPPTAFVCARNRDEELGTALYIWIPAFLTVAAITWMWLSARDRPRQA